MKKSDNDPENSSSETPFRFIIDSRHDNSWYSARLSRQSTQLFTIRRTFTERFYFIVSSSFVKNFHGKLPYTYVCLLYFTNCPILLFLDILSPFYNWRVELFFLIKLFLKENGLIFILKIGDYKFQINIKYYEIVLNYICSSCFAACLKNNFLMGILGLTTWKF